MSHFVGVADRSFVMIVVFASQAIGRLKIAEIVSDVKKSTVEYFMSSLIQRERGLMSAK